MSGPALRGDREGSVRAFSVQGTLQRCWDFPAVADPPAPGADTRPVFMVHGFRGDHHGLLRIAAALPHRRVLIPDLPGFGAGAPLPGRHDTAAYADFVAAALDRLDLGPDTVLLGHSFGSIIASAFTARNPGRVDALVLVNPICEPALEGPRGIASKAAELYYRAGAALPEPLGLALLRNGAVVRGSSMLMAKTRDRGLRRWIHAQHDAYFSAFSSRRVVLEAFQASIADTVRDVAGGLRLPVLLIAAERDDLGSVAGQRKLAAAMPDAELHVLPGVGHLVHYERPDAAGDLIEGFLARRSAAEAGS